MSKNNNLGDFLKDLANAIREKKGSTELINPQNFSDEIRNLQGKSGKYISINENNSDLIYLLIRFSDSFGIDLFNTVCKISAEGKALACPLTLFLNISTYSGAPLSDMINALYIPSIMYIPDLSVSTNGYYCDSVEALQYVGDAFGAEVDINTLITPYEITEEEFLDGLIYGMPELGSGF